MSLWYQNVCVELVPSFVLRWDAPTSKPLVAPKQEKSLG